jgi:hypothetical protein
MKRAAIATTAVLIASVEIATATNLMNDRIDGGILKCEGRV